MASRRAIYAARFLKPPGFFKRLQMREKPRLHTGPFENPVRKFVRLREKAREFAELPPPRRIPKVRPPPRKVLTSVTGVPEVSPEVLQRRLEFLLSPRAVQQQVEAPLRPGQWPVQPELAIWRQQMTEVRRIYRAQYLQKLAEVTEEERLKQEEIRLADKAERYERKQKIMQKIGEDKKRQAILMDRKRIERKVNEAIEMARKSKEKRRRLFWLRTADAAADYINKANLDERLVADSAETDRTSGEPGGYGQLPHVGKKTRVRLFDRNVSVPFLMRQLKVASEFPRQKNRRIQADNIFREIQEESYEDLPEDAELYEEEPDLTGQLSLRQRAHVEYSGFSDTEKLGLLNEQLQLIQAKMADDEAKGRSDVATQMLLDQLTATKQAAEEKLASNTQRRLTQAEPSPGDTSEK
mmetsp:Transcript_21000/g.47031  ORF Transcript_21000/g.47031 Transcript_21000/m.47031 type:complete len:411 (+) Transcript_21000:69-1301(+)|eukprot:CAMPEP_0204334004 /NCGR_PEP_ID=MMETSP0469-20131031/17683_1 /ASSEMBLY_ACC=CAM_ASM_000384 /TAXON_ID=2969 /ORGANISM="Oxyrrhis marina" /LENGTH=410 /DNA_ID=CAMNT_0051317447 /DNA_START=33 /DNA_END=1265 /DNA_ORIENTATION=-